MSLKPKRTKLLPTELEIEKYRMLVPLLNKMHVELKELSKKKPDG